jgi:hypothetical protein
VWNSGLTILDSWIGNRENLAGKSWVWSPGLYEHHIRTTLDQVKNFLSCLPPGAAKSTARQIDEATPNLSFGGLDEIIGKAQNAAGDAAGSAKSAVGGAKGDAKSAAGDVASSAKQAGGDVKGEPPNALIHFTSPEYCTPPTHTPFKFNPWKFYLLHSSRIRLIGRPIYYIRLRLGSNST